MDKPRQRIGEPLRGAAEGTPSPTGVPGSPPPTPRGRNLVPLLVAVTVIALFAAGVALYRHVQDETDNAPDRDALPVVGQTLVGFDDVAMPLPTGWSIDDYRCGQPQSNTVAIPPLGPYEACASGRAPGVSDIQLDELGSPLGRTWSDVATDEVTLAYEDLLLATVQMPDGAAAVPDLRGVPRGEAMADLADVGLLAEVTRVPSLAKGVVVDITPQAGLVMPAGTAIRVGVGN
ncbi:MAG TPA: PASTA domain-containing protein [Nocardioidaceae bacterium]|nr:PASTA domain-containing protein [Nocardioidaceae bacterium]